LTGALLTAAILGCVTESLPPYVENAPPVINGLSYAPNDSAGIRDTVAVTCLASDPNGDSMSFRWHCVEGRFIDTINAIQYAGRRRTHSESISPGWKCMTGGGRNPKYPPASTS